MVLIVVSLAIFLDALDVSIVAIALPSIQRDLQLTTAELQWVSGSYLLVYAGLQLLGGRTADLPGRRRIFLLGAMLFGRLCCKNPKRNTKDGASPFFCCA